MYMYWIHLAILMVIVIGFVFGIIKDSIKIVFLSFVLSVLFELTFLRSDIYNYCWKIDVCDDIGVCAESVPFGDGGYTEEKCLLVRGFWYKDDGVCSLHAEKNPDSYTQKVKDVLFKNYYKINKK